MLGTKGICKKYNVDEGAVYRAVRRGELIHHKVDGKLQVKEADAEKWYNDKYLLTRSEKMVSMHQLSQLTGISYSVIQRAVTSGELPATRVPFQKGYMYQIERTKALEWSETKTRKTKKSHGIVEAKKCKLPIGRKVEYKLDIESRLSDKIQRGKIIDKTDHLIVVENDLGFVECFTHFDYTQGELKAI